MSWPLALVIVAAFIAGVTFGGVAVMAGLQQSYEQKTERVFVLCEALVRKLNCLDRLERKAEETNRRSGPRLM